MPDVEICKMENPHKIVVTDDMRLETSTPRLLITAQSYRWQTVSNWNALPESMRTELSLERFKRQLRNWMKDRRYDDRLPAEQHDDDSQPVNSFPPDDRPLIADLN